MEEEEEEKEEEEEEEEKAIVRSAPDGSDKNGPKERLKIGYIYGLRKYVRCGLKMV